MELALYFLTGLWISAIGAYFFHKGQGYKKSSLNKMISQGSKFWVPGGLFTPRGPHLHPTKDRPTPELRSNKMIFLGILIMTVGFTLIVYEFYNIPPYTSPN